MIPGQKFNTSDYFKPRLVRDWLRPRPPHPLLNPPPDSAAGISCGLVWYWFRNSRKQPRGVAAPGHSLAFLAPGTPIKDCYWTTKKIT